MGRMPGTIKIVAGLKRAERDREANIRGTVKDHDTN
jgi:hypothetical protein